MLMLLLTVGTYSVKASGAKQLCTFPFKACLKVLLQAACDCPEQLGGISAGGWIALSLFIGMFLGSSTTLLIQCWKRGRELRYMGKVHTSCQLHPGLD